MNAQNCMQIKTHKSPCDLDLWLMTVKFKRFLEVVEICIHSKFYQAKCSSSWVTVLTAFFVLSRNGEKSENPVLWLDLWPMTLMFNRVLAVVKAHVRAKFHQASCSGSWVIVFTEKKKIKNLVFISHLWSHHANYSQFKCANLFQNISIIISEPQFFFTLRLYDPTGRGFCCRPQIGVFSGESLSVGHRRRLLFFAMGA